MHVRRILVPAAVVALSLAAFGCRRDETGSSSTRTTSAGTEDTTRTPTTTQAEAHNAPNAPMGQGATTAAGTPQGGATPLSDSDQKFLKKAAEGSLTEISAARHVQQAGSNPEVKAYATKLLTEHTKSNEDLQKLAMQKGITLPAKIEGGHEDMVEGLTKLSGAQLDKKYAKEMVEDHEKDVKDFREASKDVKDPDLRAWAQKQVPILEGHLTEAKTLEKKIK